MSDFVPDLLLIDANSIGYAAMYQPNLAKLSSNGFSTSALHGLPASVFKVMGLYPQAVPLVLWDGRAQWRYDIYPDYKSEREATPEKIEIRRMYREQVPYLRQMLFDLGFPQVSHPETEADDIAGVITRNLPYTQEDLKVLLVTTDSDWVQALSPNVRFFYTRDESVTDLERLASPEFKDGPFDSTEQYLSAKCMAGDDSDTITGVAGVGLKTAAKFLREHGSFEALWDKADAGQSFKGVKLLSIIAPQARDLYRRNRRLMDWSLAQMPHDLSVSMPAPSIRHALALAEQFELRRLADRMKSFSVDRDRWGKVCRLVEASLAVRGVDRQLDA